MGRVRGESGEREEVRVGRKRIGVGVGREVQEWGRERGKSGKRWEERERRV